MRYLKEFIQKYSKTIESFELKDIFLDLHFDIKELKNLKCLTSCKDVKENGLIDLSQIYKLKQCYTNMTEFTFEEVLHFEGADYIIKSDGFNQENFEMYLKMLKNGEVHRNLKNLRVSSKISSRNNLNSKKLAKILDAFDFFGENDKSFQFNFVLEKSYPKSICFVSHFEYSFVVKISSDYYEGIIENRIKKFVRQDDFSIGWFDLPLEMRQLIIDEMDIKTRCKFAQCSKKCEDEVKISKYFLTGIKITKNQIHISLEHLYYLYCLEFIDVLDLDEPRAIVIYKT
ncbi:unnamed protein product [Caenorhabditis angaria]|uniref:F-box domain-containing protein n=1 Tax=Caenorhabditis angaria TaxID=860376 RepID=A0A9P1MUB6_9PELO|nr:unnamed protein product [Caenorhabditis angaria]